MTVSPQSSPVQAHVVLWRRINLRAKSPDRMKFNEILMLPIWLSVALTVKCQSSVVVKTSRCFFFFLDECSYAFRPFWFVFLLPGGVSYWSGRIQTATDVLAFDCYSCSSVLDRLWKPPNTNPGPAWEQRPREKWKSRFKGSTKGR